MIPLVPIFANHAAGLAVASYDGEIVFGLSGDHGAMPDIDVLADGLAGSLADLRAIVGIAAPAAA